MPIATDYKLIPLAQLAKHEDAVLRGLDDLPIRYAKALLEEPEIRYPFLYYALLTHWPELLNGAAERDSLLVNRLYWFLRLSKSYRKEHDKVAGFESAGPALLDAARRELGEEVIHDLEGSASNEEEFTVAFSDFTISEVIKQFGIKFDSSADFFSAAPSVATNPALLQQLKKRVPLAINIDTEKSRSEIIVAPILLEVRDLLDGKISFFSGVEWNVDDSQGLRGRCDFLMGLTPTQMVIEAPVLAVVEVKNEDTHLGIGQCLAELVAARIFNQQNNTSVPVLYGIVTTGSNWRFSIHRQHRLHRCYRVLHRRRGTDRWHHCQHVHEQRRASQVLIDSHQEILDASS